ncbi:MAG TPA: SsrA-binding protein SmpB [Acidimicrobiia bacterium]|nr:SsrA-binding protein SmpB [Acidimicrobiia bacterium]
MAERTDAKAEGVKVVASNRRARYDYQILDRFEAGLVLEGSEVKSLRAGKAQLKDSFAHIRDGEVWLVGAYIAPYDFSRGGGHEPERTRKLLLQRRQIDRLASRLAEQGLTLVPLDIHFRAGRVKVELGLAKGKRTIDKRETIKARDQQREIDRAVRKRSR